MTFTASLDSEDLRGNLESSDADKIGSRHYQDYLIQKEISEDNLGTPVTNRAINNFTSAVIMHNNPKFNSTFRTSHKNFTVEEIKENHFAKI